MRSTELHADAYSHARARDYAEHHEKNLRTRFTTWRERWIVRAALKRAGAPAIALDLPCGTGRFWPAFACAGVRRLIAADNSDGMLAIAAGRQGIGMAVRLLKTSAFAIEMSDGAVPFAASLRFQHHLARSEDRSLALAELHRVSSRFVLVSVWTDGNVQAWQRRRRKDKREQVAGYGRRVCLPRAQLEDEYLRAGFRVLKYWRVWPGLSMWTFYLLERANAG